jgi:hypothetical protein
VSGEVTVTVKCALAKEAEKTERFPRNKFKN